MVKFLEKIFKRVFGLFKVQPALIKPSQKTTFKKTITDYSNRDEINRRWR